jgi:hypothetical protein
VKNSLTGNAKFFKTRDYKGDIEGIDFDFSEFVSQFTKEQWDVFVTGIDCRKKVKMTLTIEL